MLVEKKAAKILIIGIGLLIGLSACQKKSDILPTENPKEETVAMSATPADNKNEPIVIPTTDTLVKDEKAPPHDEPMPNETVHDKDNNDNSAMENISENDQVIDSNPASPHAPVAEKDKKR